MPNILGPGGDLKTVYGIYLYQKDCFLITFFDLTTINHLATILSSKTPCQVLELNSFKNWRENLIDNTVCTNWSISNNCLIETSPCSEEVKNLQCYALYCLLIIDRIRYLESNELDFMYNSTFNESKSVRDFFIDDISVNLFQSTATEEAALSESFKKFSKLVYSACYWATTIEELDYKLDQLYCQQGYWSSLFFLFFRAIL